MKSKKELELEYVQTRTEIKTHMTMIKAYVDSIQKSKDQMSVLAKKLEDIQELYKQYGYADLQGESDEQINKQI